MTKVDSYKHEEKYKKWKEKVLITGVPDVTKVN